ncbi:MAG TPA: hypothetical protein VMT79_05565 [Candidatus Binatia bacterium]|nr:hypothetical protein [Candidatus Binatia bacterium]
MSRAAITRLLLVEDSAGEARLLRAMFNEHEAPRPDVTWVAFMRDAEKHLAEHAVDIHPHPPSPGREGVVALPSPAPSAGVRAPGM